MLSKAKTKFILSLQKKKRRDEEKLFTVEGDKMVRELLMSDLSVAMLAGKPEYLGSLPRELKSKAGEIISVNHDELKRISSLATPHNALAVVKIPDTVISRNEVMNSLSVMLDSIQDPGNLGTIIRAAAWFGLRNIFCSPNCADLYNPKVIQATMGAILHVKVIYCSLTDKLKEMSADGLPVFGTLLEGESIYEHMLGTTGIILIGNESRGITAGLLPFLSHRIMIPKFFSGRAGIDSLNAGMAASVVFSEFAKRRGSP